MASRQLKLELAAGFVGGDDLTRGRDEETLI
jgi:hypothetical protein